MATLMVFVLQDILELDLNNDWEVMANFFDILRNIKMMKMMKPFDNSYGFETCVKKANSGRSIYQVRKHFSANHLKTVYRCI